MRLSPRASRIDASGIRKVFDLAEALENPVNLSIGQPDFDVPESVKEEMIRAIRDGKNRYTPTQGIAPLRERLRARLAKEKGIRATEEEILVTSGVSGGLLLGFLAAFGPGDEVLIPDPYFVMYKHLLNVFEITPVFVDTYPDFRMTAERLAKHVTPRTRGIVLGSPSNPTGVALSRAELEKIASLAAKHDLLVVSDEIYDGFVYDGEPFSIGSVHPLTLTLGGWSKSYAMTGWRLGWAAGPRELIQAMTMFQQYTFVAAPTPVQWAGIAALDVDLAPIRAAYRAKRDRLVRGLGDILTFPVPEGAFYLFAEIPAGEKNATEFCARLIEKDSLLVIPGGVFSERDTHIRIAYAASDAVIDRGVEILRRAARR